METRKAPNKAETRAVQGLKLETRADGVEQLVGYPIVFNFRSVLIWDFYEIVNPDAVTETLKDSDIRALYAHDAAHVLGREQSGTLKLTADDHGVRMELTPPDTTVGQDVIKSVRRGDIDGMSFGFDVMPGGELWHTEGEDLIRELTNIDVLEVSVVTWPAYPDTDVAVRSRDQWRQSQTPGGRHPDVLRLRLELDEQTRVR